ncbi:hypothetical protein C4D60_Mb11t15980 [Musa balbisiana]|uniref:Uncharacterized protein n=1 Tax=Musa balbisiana TaxID=52838 RepID=A0A4S8J4L5_MUSBA|nr:hypothetical protein C4D60_Mb11t15980 [Musa balbisiana]
MPPISETGDPSRTDISDLVISSPSLVVFSTLFFGTRPQISLRPLLEQVVDVSRNLPPSDLRRSLLFLGRSGVQEVAGDTVEENGKQTELRARKKSWSQWARKMAPCWISPSPCRRFIQEVGLSPPLHKRYANKKVIFSTSNDRKESIHIYHLQS